MVNSSITIRDIYILLSIMDRTTRKKIKKEIKDLNSIIN